MKILHITDSHGTVKGPESRKDIYYITFLRKLYELGYVIKKEKIDIVVHTGDLFHTARVSDKFAGQVSEMIKSWQIPVYVVPGNHDIEGYTIDTIDQTKLGLLAKAGVIQLLDRDNPITITSNQDGEEYTVAISGQEYYAHIDEGNMHDFEMQQDEADFNILAIHGYIADTPQHPNIKCTMCQDIISDADVILTGHYHRQFEWSDGQNLDIFNPGSMMRVEQTDYNKTHIPQYGILNIELNNSGNIEWNYKFHEFKIAQPSTTVFDYNSKYKAKAASITLEGFKTSIANTMNQMQPSLGIPNLINDICMNAKVDASVTTKALDIYNNTLQTIPDEFEVQQGYIPAQNQKYITSVTLKNFQAHKDTTVHFDKGLNIIVGESNNGKTSILRGILWAIDNQPLGNDFIMAGENECSVTINFSDGTYIERGRTVKDTGYYKIRYIDDNGKYIDQTYRGFTNAVPIEVANVHQMPKVNITKDIETHLNVLSQLDGPFLLTESPLVKASAIGRITGTHVLDTGVKETNKTIQSNKKTIKVYNESLAEKEIELKGLPDIDLYQKLSSKHHSIYKYIYTQLSRLLKIQEDYDKAISYDDKINNAIEERNNKKSIAKLLPAITNAQYKVNKCYVLSSGIDNYYQLETDLKRNYSIMESGKFFTRLSPVVNTANNIITKIQELDKNLNAINNCDYQISQINLYKDSTANFAKVSNSILIYCGILIGFINKVQPKIDLIDNISSNEESMKSECNGHKKLIKSIKISITELQKERSKFVLDNGICPCCGQAVTDVTHSDSIINFFKED